VAYILQIDTSTENAIVSLSQNENVLHYIINKDQKNHASFLQPAIKNIVASCNISLNEVDAVAVVIGPGSYTGLRVGLAGAKGLCFALQKPLLTLNTLEAMAFTATMGTDQYTYLCPMIDARRMEVFTAVYDNKMKVIVEPCAVVLEAETFKSLFLNNKVLLNGSGAKKLIDISENKNLMFFEPAISPVAMAKLFTNKFKARDFADVAYSEPFYAKPFYTIQPKSK
jgi:tRNA threonylcarbamoyladenosine biosynthesis protein TsaB